MGFYGNITNTSNTTFSFDKIYSNRREMDSNANNDGIFIGRYVLVEYDQDAAYPNVFLKDGQYYSSPNTEDLTRVRFLSGERYDYILTTDEYPIKGKQYYIKIEEGVFEPVDIKSNTRLEVNKYYEKVESVDGVYEEEIVQVQEISTDDKGHTTYINIGFYECNGSVTENSIKYATFKKITKDPTAKSNYIQNFAIDEKHQDAEQQKSFKGYDSTVWVKSSITTNDGKLITKYVNIADLNSVVPTFDIAADAPTMVPITPHFDADSTNVYYKLHAQPQWGFRVAAADSNEKSDEMITWISDKYDKNNNTLSKIYYDTVDQTWKPYDSTAVGATAFDGAIYYNSAGFNSQKSNKDTITGDAITITPTGVSGQLYVNHDDKTSSEKTAPDIQELKIMLPSLGNAVSDMWDLVYGSGDSNNENKRNMEVAWNNVTGLRQTLLEDGYKYDTDEGINTLAGCINSVHDLMGMIIEEMPAQEDISLYNSYTIYWDPNEKVFKRLGTNYHFTDIDNNLYFYEPVTGLTKESYEKNVYYYKEEEVFQPALLPFDSYDSPNFYKRCLFADYHKINEVMSDYEPNKYYYKLNDDYIQETKTTWNESVNYYIIDLNISSRNFKEKYVSSTYYYNENNNYILDTADIPSKTNTDYYKLKITQKEGKPWVSGKFYFYDDTDGSYDLATSFISGEDYWELAQGTNSELILKPIKVFDVTKENCYIKNNNNYVLATSNEAEKTYYSIEIIEAESYNSNDLYIPNVYYYKDNNNYKLSGINDFVANNREYYILNDDVCHPCVFYIPNTYYKQKADGSYDLITESTAVSDTIYFKHGEAQYYIKDDRNGVYGVGEKWNDFVELVPASVTLATKVETPALVELPQFARSYNTIHGLILRLNNILENNNIYTRDTSTLQGAINKLNDIFAKFTTLKPKHFLTVGQSGKIYSTDYTTKQSYSTYNVGTGVRTEEEEQATIENRFIDFDLDEIEHQFVINHKYNGVGDTETKSNKNNISDGDGLNNGDQNELKLYTPIIDNMGHVVGKNTETVTLPYGYKYIEVANDGNTPAAPVSTAGTQMADNTQDTLKLTTSNEWILLDAEEEDTVKFGHLLKTIAEDKKPTQNLSSEESKTITFEVYDDSFDEAGHHSGRDTKTLTMPFGYGKIKGDNGSNTAATATYDELSVVSGDAWINTQVSPDTVTITHTGPVITAVETKNNIENPSFGSTFVIEDWHFDDKGHMHTLGKTHTVQFPKGNIIHPTTYSNNAEIITSLAFNPESGVISYQKDNSGTLKLTANYTNEGINSGSISGGDSLNTAFAKLEKQVIKEANDRATDILKEVSDRNLAISSAISAIVDKNDDGTINKLAEVIDWINNNPSTATQMQTAIQNNTKAISEEVTRAQDAEAKLQNQIDSLGTAAQSQVEDFATAEQGLLAETAIQPDTEFIYTFKDADTGEILIPEIKMTIEALVKKVAELENEIRILKGE